MFNSEEKDSILDHAKNIYKYFLMYEISLTKFIDYNIFTIDPFIDVYQHTELSKGVEIHKEEFEKFDLLQPYLDIVGEIEEEQEPTDDKEATNELEEMKKSLDSDKEDSGDEKDIENSQKIEKSIEENEEQKLIRGMVEERIEAEKENFEGQKIADID